MTDIELGAFLSGPGSPEHEALLRLIGASILNPRGAEADYESLPVNTGREWSDAEMNALGEMLVRGVSMDEIARRLRRDKVEVRDRWSSWAAPAGRGDRRAGRNSRRAGAAQFALLAAEYGGRGLEFGEPAGGNRCHYKGSGWHRRAAVSRIHLTFGFMPENRCNVKEGRGLTALSLIVAAREPARERSANCCYRICYRTR